MGAAMTGPVRVASTSHPPAVPQPTEAALTAAGLPPEPYTTMHVELLRVSAKGK